MRRVGNVSGWSTKNPCKDDLIRFFILNNIQPHQVIKRKGNHERKQVVTRNRAYIQPKYPVTNNCHTLSSLPSPRARRNARTPTFHNPLQSRPSTIHFSLNLPQSTSVPNLSSPTRRNRQDKRPPHRDPSMHRRQPRHRNAPQRRGTRGRMHRRAGRLSDGRESGRVLLLVVVVMVRRTVREVGLEGDFRRR